MKADRTGIVAIWAVNAGGLERIKGSYSRLPTSQGRFLGLRLQSVTIPVTGIPVSVFLSHNFCWFSLIFLLVGFITFSFVLDIVFEKLAIEVF